MARKKHRVLMAVCSSLVLFLVLFPKGGIKVGSAPATWGYLILGGSAPFVLVVRLLKVPLRVPRRVLAAFLLVLPMLAVLTYAAALYGTEFAWASSDYINVGLLPFCFLFLYPPFLRWVDGRRLSAVFRFCVLTAACWGLLLFLLFPLTGHIFEIPYLTVNAADAGRIELTKHIQRGFFLKLIATYNNGNVYGVATLILLPLYSVLERSLWRRLTVRLALLLTLSRTVWIGLLIAECLPMLGSLLSQYSTFPIVRLNRAGKRVAALLATLATVFAVLLMMPGYGLGFLFDPTAGGRIGEIHVAHALTLLPHAVVTGFAEIMYATALQDYGVIGFVSMLLWMLSPLLLLPLDGRALASPSRMAAFRGLMIYAILACSDAAFNYIPVMAFYWFAYMIFLYGWPGEQTKTAFAIEASAPAPVVIPRHPVATLTR